MGPFISIFGVFTYIVYIVYSFDFFLYIASFSFLSIESKTILYVIRRLRMCFVGASCAPSRVRWMTEVRRKMIYRYDVKLSSEHHKSMMDKTR